MTDNNHPITPPPELVQQWCKQRACINEPGPIHLWLATEAARWGADQELKACCLWADITGWKGAEKSLQLVRRPKPPSLKEQALKALKNIDDACESEGFSRSDDTDIIRRALEFLPD